MENKRVDFTTAKLAKEKGFDFYDTGGYYHINKGYSSGYAFCYSDVNEQTEGCLLCPDQSLLQKWLREKRIDITVITDWKKGSRVYYVGFSFVNDKNEIDIWFSKDEDKNKIEYSEYEDALEIGLFESLQRVTETVA